MKYLITIAGICFLPLAVLAQTNRTQQLISLEDRPILTDEERAELFGERERLESTENQQTINSNRNQAGIQEFKLRQQARRQRLEELRQLKPKNPIEAVRVHEEAITERIEQLEDNEQISEEKKTDLINKFTEELTWVQEKNTALKAADTQEERQAIRQEISVHVQNARTERRQTLAETFPLPEQSPAVIAEQINQRFAQISERLTAAGKDTTELNTAITQYKTAVTTLDSHYDAVQTEKSVQNLQNLRDSIKAVRDAVNGMRNAIQSIIE